ncbi:unnamed protein product [Peniophora sp. CBMAI 1063]|nr:unnamed protein product [Peniophora sp. CBMAI 1063]
MSSNTSTPPPSGPTEAVPSTTFGPVFIGNIINWFLLGTLAVQLYIYANSAQSRKDPIWARLLICCVFLVDFAQSIIVTQEAWYRAVEIWGKTELLSSKIPWSGALISLLDGIVAWMVQSFYAWRIWTLTRGAWVRSLPILIELLSIMQFAASLAGTIGILNADGSTNSLEHIQSSIDTWLAGSFANDMIIAACMIALLYQARSRTVWVQSQSLYDRLIINTLQTGLITAVVAGVDLFLWEHYPAQYFHLTAAIILGKLYSNAFISTINGRVFREYKSNSQQSSSAGNSSGATDMGVQVHIAQQRERRIDAQTLAPPDRRKFAVDRQSPTAWKARPSSDDDSQVYELSALSKANQEESRNDANANAV